MTFQNHEDKQSYDMIDKKTTELIGKAIREGKYLNITYKNKNGDVTQFWISILDINANDELRVNIFNVTKDTKKNRIKSDEIKMELLKTKSIRLLFIPNQYVKHYEFVRELVNKFNGDVYQKTLFDGYDSPDQLNVRSH